MTPSTASFVLRSSALALCAAPALSQTSLGPQQSSTPGLPLGWPVMTEANADANLGTLFTTGNSHTGGIAWVDYNGDYLPDLMVLNGGGYEHFLFRNEGDGTFTDVSTLVAKPDIGLEDAGVACGDLDNDGDTDILIAVDNSTFMTPTLFNPIAGGPNLLYENQGDGTFVEDAAGWGIVDAGGQRNIVALLADVDLDGFLDAYMGKWAMNSGPYDHDNLFYLNNGSTFTELDVGVSAYGKDTLAALFWDANFDRYPDLYVGNVAYAHKPPGLDCNDYYFRNTTFTAFEDVTAGSPGICNDGCADMGMDVGDIDNDGDWDFYSTDKYDVPPTTPGNFLYAGEPNGLLIDNTAMPRGIAADDSWPCNFADFNQDGFTDLWVGHAADGPPDFMFINNGDGGFEEQTPIGWENGYSTTGGSIADYDADGDVDVFIWEYNNNSHLYRNDTYTADNNWVQFKLLGVTSNRDAIGAVVRVTVVGTEQLRRVSGGDSAHSQQEQILTFGLREFDTLDVTVLWPSGVVQSFSSLAANDFYVIDEVAGLLSESVQAPTVSYDPASGWMSVRAESTYGGRTKLSVEGFGALRYDAQETRFEGRFRVPQAQLPETVRVLSQRGAQRDVPVRLAKAGLAAARR